MEEFFKNFNTVLLTIGAIVWARYVYELVLLSVKKRHIPNVRSIKAARKKIVEILKDETRRFENCRIVDLGSGSGLLTQHIAKETQQANIVGVELSCFALFLAKSRAFFSSVKNLEYHRADLFQYDLSNADIVVFYLGKSMIPSLRDKFETELQSGTIIISNNFPLEGEWVPEKVVEIESIYKHQKQIYVYKKP